MRIAVLAVLVVVILSSCVATIDLNEPSDDIVPGETEPVPEPTEQVEEPIETTSDGALPNGVRMGDLRVFDSTMHSISIEWDLEGDANHDAESQVRFRKAGTSAWTEFMPLLRSDFMYPAELTNFGMPDERGFDMLAGSIMFLTPGTEYDVWLEVEDPDGGSATLVRTIATKPIPQRSEACTRTIGPSELASAYGAARPGDVLCLESGRYGDFRAARSGSSQGFIALVNAPGAVPRFDRIFVDASYLWLEGLTFDAGLDGYAAAINSRSHIDAHHVVVKDNTFEGYHYSISIKGPYAKYWYIVDNVIVGDKMAPTGTGADFSGEGIELSHSSGHTIAYNTISSVADGISYPHRNVDVFGNDIFRTNDDSLEPDSGYANNRFWGNRMRDSYNYALSFQPMHSGPWYFIRNEVRQTAWTRQGRSETSTGGTIFKFNGVVDRFVLVHNTFVTEAISPVAPTRLNVLLASYSRNNLYVVPGSPVWRYEPWSGDTTVIPAPSFYANDWRTDVDYDGFSWSGTYGFSWDGTNHEDIGSFANAVGIEANGIRFDRTDFVAYPTDLQPRAATPIVDSGAIVAGVNENHLGSAPDRGAYEHGAQRPWYGAGPSETLRERHAYWEFH